MQEPNKIRKEKQRASYKSEFKPKQKPRSRYWQKGLKQDQIPKFRKK